MQPPPRRPPSRPKPKKTFQVPKVIFQPRVMEGMNNGFAKLVGLIRPTLGPLPRVVAIEHYSGRNHMPEVLDSGGTIARRVIQIHDREEDVGFMFLRQALCHQQEAHGDGTATLAVLFQAIFNGGRKYVSAGGDPMALRHYLEDGLRLILNDLEKQKTQLSGKHELVKLARTICYDEELSKFMGEIFDIIGAYGRLEVRRGNRRELVREYVEGMYWEGGLRSREMANTKFGLRAILENAAIFISDLEIEWPEQLIPLLELSVKNGIKQLLLVSTTISDRSISLLLAKPNKEKVQVVAVKTPGISTYAQWDAMTDLAILTGGQPLAKVNGATLEGIHLEDLGRARRIWADKDFFGIVNGRGDARQIRQHLAGLRASFHAVGEAQERKQLLERIGKILGGSATLYVGSVSPSLTEERMELAKRTADAMRGAMQEGVVPGGGAALMACRDTLRTVRTKARDNDQAAAYGILLQALEVPFRAIVGNAGIRPESVLAEVERRGPGFGYDVLRRQVVDVREAGLFDSAAVVKSGVRTAIAEAALALTTEAIVHRRIPPEEVNP